MPPWTRLRRHPVWTVIAVAACLLLASGAYLLVQQARARDHWRQADQAVADHEFDQAQAHLAAYLEQRPDAAEAHFRLARVCRRARRENFDRAAHHLAEARRLGWSEEELAIEGRLLEFQKRGTPEAGEKIVLGLLESPAIERRLVLETLARGCLRAGRFEDATGWFGGWLRAYPDDWYVHLWLGTLALHIDMPGRAAAVFDRLLELRPQTDVRQRLGLALVSSGNDFPRALELLEGHRQSHPDDPDTRIGIARCQTVLNQPEAARALLREVLAAAPDHPTALEALAVVEMDLENYPAALELLQRLEPMAWDPPEEEMLQRLLRLEPTADGRSVADRRRSVYHRLATVLHRLGRSAEGRDYDRRVEQLIADTKALIDASADGAKANDANMWYRLAVLNLRVGNRTNGEFWLKRVRDADPKDPRPDQALADYYRSRPDPESRKKADGHQGRAKETSQ